VHELSPDALAYGAGIGVVQPMPAADRPDERGVLLDLRVPRLFPAVSRASHQVGDQQIIAHRLTSFRYAHGVMLARPAAAALRLEMRRRGDVARWP
jgi:hypothetical protein